MVTSRRLLIALRIAAAALSVLAVAFIASGAYLYALAQELPALEDASAGLKAARTSIVYASDGSVLAEWHGEEDRKVIAFDDVPEPVRDAVIAVEDPRFREHRGVDWDAVTRALAGRRGGSSITQQLVRMLYRDSDRSLTTKIRQALSAYQLEARVSKDRVLEGYLNMVYFGQGRYGIESAARAYFDKPASALTLPEAALLAGLIDAPERYSPTRDPRAARLRRDEVLDLMRDQGLITSEQEVAARSATLGVSPRVQDGAIVAPYFVEYVKQDLIDRLGARRVFTGGLRIHTTLDPRVQQRAERAVASVLDRPGDPEAALVCIDPHTGAILAMVGGRDFASAQYNLATQGRRQPGSAFKPFVLVAALEQGVSPDQRFSTRPYTVRVKDGVWRVENYENEFPAARITLRAATDYSVNAVYARLVMQVGPERVAETARRMGITSRLDPNPAIALGGLSRGVSPLEMASAYGTLATGGVRIPHTGVLKVTDDRGSVLAEASEESSRVLSREVATRASGMLHEVVQRGTGVNARIGTWAAGKTGTTQNYRDAWFVGYTGDLVAAVWVGYRQAQVAMTDVHGIKVAGGTFPATIWSRFMSSVAAEAPATRAATATGTVPGGPGADSGTVSVRVCRDTFLVANDRCPNVATMELPREQMPPGVCYKH